MRIEDGMLVRVTQPDLLDYELIGIARPHHRFPILFTIHNGRGESSGFLRNRGPSGWDGYNVELLE